MRRAFSPLAFAGASSSKSTLSRLESCDMRLEIGDEDRRGWDLESVPDESRRTSPVSSASDLVSCCSASGGCGLLLAEADLFVRDRTDTASTASSNESFSAACGRCSQQQCAGWSGSAAVDGPCRATPSPAEQAGERTVSGSEAGGDAAAASFDSCP